MKSAPNTIHTSLHTYMDNLRYRYKNNEEWGKVKEAMWKIDQFMDEHTDSSLESISQGVENYLDAVNSMSKEKLQE